jgi:hypothetical protein
MAMKEPVGRVDSDGFHFTVYFSTLDGMPLTNFHRVLVWLTRIFSGSRIVHCAFGDERAVLSSTIGGATLWPTALFEARYPGLVARCNFISPNPVMLEYFVEKVGTKQPIWPTLWRYLSGGAGHWNNDCLCTTILCLRVAGLDVPADITTPVGLLRWLKHKGFTVAKPQH